MYVLKFTDQKYDDWAYCGKGFPFSFQKYGCFREHFLFESVEAAFEYVAKAMEKKYLISDVKMEHFVPIKVNQYAGYGSAWYTDDYIAELKALNDRQMN